MTTKKTIHVHQQKIRKGEPAIIVRDYKGSKHYTKIEILGPCTMIHTPEPDSCGARVVLVTESEVVGHV